MDQISAQALGQIGKALLNGLAAYLVLLLLLRVSGKRTLSTLNMFDFVVTVAFGSTLATILLSQEIPLLYGVSLFALLILVQYAVTWLSVRYPLIRNAVTGKPTLVFSDGCFIRSAMKEVRITESELLQAIRSQGIGSLQLVKAIVIETNGNISVITRVSDSLNTVDFSQIA